MTRKKVKLALIESKTERKASYKKRKKGLIKKVKEISTLCGIDACAIIYGPYDEYEPEIWPPSTYAVQNLLSRFKMLPEKYKKIVNQEAFTKQRVEKMHEQIRKKVKSNREKELTSVIYRCLAGEEVQNFRGVVDFNDLDWLISRNVKEIAKMIEFLKNQTLQMPPTERSLETISVGGNNESIISPKMPVNEKQNFTGLGANSSMVAPHEMPLNEIQNITFSATNSFMVAPEMPSNDQMQNLTWLASPEMQNVTWPTYNLSMVIPELMPMNEMLNPTWWSTNNVSMVAPEMPMNEMHNLGWLPTNASSSRVAPELQNVTFWSTNNNSMVVPEMPMNEMQNWTNWTSINNACASMVAPEMFMNEKQNVTWSTNNASIIAPELPMNYGMQQNSAWSGDDASVVAPEIPMNELESLTKDMNVLSINQQTRLSGYIWDDHIFHPFINNNGAGPSNSVP